MIDVEQLRDCYISTPSKIVMLLIDGLGGLAHPDTGLSELETASIPNLDSLCLQSACGLTTPVLPGVIPGSGPGHLALFGYDPLKYSVGRGVMEALGIEAVIESGDVAARGNFATIDADGLISDRRAGRIPSDISAQLCEVLDQIELDDIHLNDVRLKVYPVHDHRFVLHLSGADLSDKVCRTDPQQNGAPPWDAVALAPEAEKTAQAIRSFVDKSKLALKEEPRANVVLLRGFSQLPSLPDMGEVYRLNPAGIAAYPMYRGLAKVAGMRVIPTGKTFADEIKTLEDHYSEHDFFFIHYKPADTAGEDGNFAGKVKALEDLDTFIPKLLALKPDVLMVAGDHSTPAIAAAHTWHPVPLLVHSVLTAGDGVSEFTERACALGSIGRVPATGVMMLALANAGKLQRFGP